MAIGDGWAEGSWVDAGWIAGAWTASVVAINKVATVINRIHIAIARGIRQ
jgi:hypothetical protein